MMTVRLKIVTVMVVVDTAIVRIVRIVVMVVVVLGRRTSGKNSVSYSR